MTCKLSCFGTSGRNHFDFEARFKDGFAKLTRQGWMSSGFLGVSRPRKDRVGYGSNAFSARRYTVTELRLPNSYL